jgi:multiple sugar transport system permease protein
MKKGFQRFFRGLIVLGALTYLFPLFYMFLRSFLDNSFPGHFGLDTFTLAHYRQVLGHSGFFRYFINSVVVLVPIVGANLIISVMVGFAFARFQFPAKNLLFGLVLATLMVPKQILMVPILEVITRLGIHNTFAALILPFCGDSFNIFLLRQYIRQIPPDMEDAARVDGAGELRILREVVFPMCRPALAVVIINTSIVTWNSFLFPLILTDSATMRTLPVGMAMFTQGPFSTDWGALMAGASVSSLPLILVFLVFQREIIEGIISGAVKE